MSLEELPLLRPSQMDVVRIEEALGLLVGLQKLKLLHQGLEQPHSLVVGQVEVYLLVLHQHHFGQESLLGGFLTN